MTFSEFVENVIETPICCELKRYLDKLYELYEKDYNHEQEKLGMKLTKEEFKVANNNIMTVMENHIIMLARCDRTTANRIVKEILELERDADRILEELKVEEKCNLITKEEFKEANKNIMTVIENHIIMRSSCDRTIANRIAKEIMDLERDVDRVLDEVKLEEKCI